MKNKRHAKAQIAFALRQAESGAAVAEIARKMQIFEATFYRWKQKFDGLWVAEVRRLKQLEEENLASSNNWWRTCSWTSRCSRMP